MDNVAVVLYRRPGDSIRRLMVEGTYPDAKLALLGVQASQRFDARPPVSGPYEYFILEGELVPSDVHEAADKFIAEEIQP